MWKIVWQYPDGRQRPMAGKVQPYKTQKEAEKRMAILNQAVKVKGNGRYVVVSLDQQ